MRHLNRKSTPKVIGGRVQYKNNLEWTPNYYNSPQPAPVIDRQRPGKGYRHLLKQRDIEMFIGLLPDWTELSRGLNAIVLAPGERTTVGWHEPGVVYLCAWEEGMWKDYKSNTTFFRDHEELFSRLGVEMKVSDDGYTLCNFTESQARAYQLLHIFLHELGHHHDRMTTQSKVRASRGEPYAEAYALRYEAQIWERYQDIFGLFERIPK